jgi:hypothetical protein
MSGVPTGTQRSLTTLRVLVRLGLHVDNVDRLPLDDGSAGRCSPTGPGKEICP